ncbi:hypothetical protein GJAV_G00108130 [Gymnothorax javanicus]|nr:hypothetical protein GJAV_G00108130 [Gymnothorax javanicus]
MTHTGVSQEKLEEHVQPDLHQEKCAQTRGLGIDILGKLVNFSVHAEPRRRRSMFPKGTKRKCSDEDGAEKASSVTYSLQRQCLLDMSLIKLQLCHMLVEPDLRRSVLIANTVRRMQEEVMRDGGWRIVTEALAPGQGLTDRLVASEVLCHPAAAAAARDPGDRGEPEPLPHAEEVAMETLRAVAAEADSAYTAGCADPHREAGLPPEAEDSGGRLRGAESGFTDGAKVVDRIYGTFEIKSPAPNPAPALEELFSDVDTSYYDLDAMVTGVQATPKAGPFELLESLSSHAPSSTCRTDLNELDHIMEIIVGS